MSFSTNTLSGAVEMQSNGSPVPNNPVNSGAVVHGPALVSNGSLNLSAGSTVRFDWEASAGVDAYDVFGYIVDTNTGRSEIILNQTGTAARPYQARTTFSHTIQTAGNYKFVFLSGTWDATRGLAVGARLLIDDVQAVDNSVLPVAPRSKSVTINPQQTITVPVTVTTTEPGQEYNAWDFLSGAGEGDTIRLEGIPIWDTAEGAAERNNGQGYAGDSVRVGALNALYRRIVWLSDQVNGPLQTGQGFNIFSKSALAVPAAPDQEVFDKDGTLVSALTKTLNDLVDDSLLQINAHRSYFGAYFGRMTHNIANLSTQKENLSAAVSRIRDTDYGNETAAMTRTQILQQAATAMLAQANAMPNVVLGLLRQV